MPSERAYNAHCRHYEARLRRWLRSERRWRHGIRVIPTVTVLDSIGPVVPTPQYQKWPVYGEVILLMEMPYYQQVHVKVAFKDRKGKDANVDGPPQWATDNSDVLALTPDADGMGCLCAGIIAGPAKVQATADALIGDGTEPVIAVMDLNCTTGKATVGTISVDGSPTDQPDAPPPPPAPPDQPPAPAAQQQRGTRR